MKKYELKYLSKIANEYGIFEKINFDKRLATNPLENSMWENMLNGALKALELIAIGSLDWKLTAIVKLLQSWLKDRKEEKAKTKQQTEYGYGGYDTYDTYDTYY